MRALLIALLAASSLLAQSGRSIGPSMAKVVVEVFSDYQCPTCKQLYEKTLKQFIAEYARTGKVKFIHREFPLAIHAYSKEAACLACAADRVGKYEQVCAALFRDQELWSKTGTVADSACSVLTPAEAKKVRELARTTEVRNEVEADIRLGVARGVGSTPTTFIHAGNRDYPQIGFYGYPIFKRAIDGFLAH